MLCEKPLGLNPREVQEMISLAKEKDVFFMEVSGKLISIKTLLAWYFTEATKAIASMPPGHCLGALKMFQ